MSTLDADGAVLRRAAGDAQGRLAGVDATEASDVDVLVDYEPGTRLSFLRVGELRYKLEDLLGAQVDVVTTGGLRSEIRDEVLREAIRAA